MSVQQKPMPRIVATKIHECRRCPNSTANPSVSLGSDGLCNVCAAFERSFDPQRLADERRLLKSFVGRGRGRHDALVGISGGKDSTAMLHTIKEMGFAPLAFTLDSGYYPEHVFSRSEAVARQLGVDWIRIPIKKYARRVDLACYEKTAELYDLPDTVENRRVFSEQYLTGRQHYSVKCGHALAFVRSCQLCRRLVVRAYYAEAKKRGIPLVVLGINEWAGLSGTAKAGGRVVMSAFRRLKPTPASPTVQVVHLPFLLRRKKSDTVRILTRLGWRPPRGEQVVESNANSCLFALAAENRARKMLGFHPDTTRLAREVTVGFITKREAKKALAKRHFSRLSVRQVLRRAGLIV